MPISVTGGTSLNSTEQNVLEKGHLRTFGISFLVILGIIGGVLWWNSRVNAAYALWSIGAVFGLLGALMPMALLPVYRPWMVFAEKLAWFNMSLLLLITFYLVVTPIGLLMRVFGKDPMGRRKRPGSYWVRPVESRRGCKHFENQF